MHLETQQTYESLKDARHRQLEADALDAHVVWQNLGRVRPCGKLLSVRSVLMCSAIGEACTYMEEESIRNRKSHRR